MAQDDKIRLHKENNQKICNIIWDNLKKTLYAPVPEELRKNN